MSKEYISLYRDFREKARLADELELWARSYAENITCAKAIEKEISGSGSSRLSEKTARHIIGEFGYDRVNWVLASTIRQGGHEGRISEDNKAWAAKFGIPSGRTETLDYRVDSSPDALNAFINQVRREWQELAQDEDIKQIEQGMDANSPNIFMTMEMG